LRVAARVTTGLKAGVNETTKPLKRLPIATGRKPGVIEKITTPLISVALHLINTGF
jgi:hypothetical protein